MPRRFALPLLFVPSILHSQAKDTARIAPVVVSATRAPLAAGSLPVAVTVLLGEDLRLRGITTVGDALGDVSSAYVAQTGSQGGTTSLFLRGGESKYVKVLIDGVPANDPGGVYDFASLTTDNVERIEIVRGPASVVHGADAVTGVVQIFTRHGATGTQADSDLRMGTASRRAAAGSGSVTSYDLSSSLRGGGSSSSYSLMLGSHSTDGLYAFNNTYWNRVLSTRVAISPSPSTEFRLALRYTDYRYNYPTNSAGDVGDSNAFRVEDRMTVGIEVEQRSSASIRSVLAINTSVNEGGTDDGPNAAGSSYVSQDKTRRRGAEWRVQWLGAKATVTGGLAAELQDQRSESQSQSSFGPFNTAFSARRTNSAGYVEAVVSPRSTLTATLGGRVDDNEEFGVFPTARAGVSWRPRATTRLRVTAGTAFREPSFFENYATGFVLGNPGLSPEHARTVDAGVDQDVLDGRVQLAVTGFFQEFRDMIDYSGSNACGYSYCNVAEAESKGLEADALVRVVGGLSAGVAATFLSTEVVTPGYDATPGGQYRAGEALIRRPATKWSGELTYRGNGRFSASAHVLAVGPRGDRDFHFPATPVTLESYERVDIGAAWDVRRGADRATTLTLRVENLFDADYQNVFNYLTPRRTILVGARMSLQ